MQLSVRSWQILNYNMFTMTSANRQLPTTIFDHKRVATHKQRAAANFSAHDFLLREAAQRIAERLQEVKRDFSKILDISGHELFAEISGLKNIESFSCYSRNHRNPEQIKMDPRGRPEDDTILGFDKNSFDLVIAAGGLHWVNDLPGMLVQIRRVLKDDGLFLAIMPGGETLKELRQSLEQAEIKITGGISPRVSPFIDVRDAGSLLQRAGFALPVVDSDVLNVEYEHPLKLLHDLRGMGETNALVSATKHFTTRCVMMTAMEYYQEHFSNAEARVVASIEFVTLTGWSPHASQQQPAKRGSGQINLGDILQ